MTAERLVVDASVAVKWVVDEPGSAAAITATRDRLLTAPAYMLVEAANGIRKQSAAGKITPAAASSALQDLVGTPVERVPVDETLVHEALALGLELDHPLQDCLYLALARRTGARVITADHKFARAVRENGTHAERIVLLGE